MKTRFSFHIITVIPNHYWPSQIVVTTGIDMDPRFNMRISAFASFETFPCLSQAFVITPKSLCRRNKLTWKIIEQCSAAILQNYRTKIYDHSHLKDQTSLVNQEMTHKWFSQLRSQPQIQQNTPGEIRRDQKFDPPINQHASKTDLLRKNINLNLILHSIISPTLEFEKHKVSSQPKNKMHGKY